MDRVQKQSWSGSRAQSCTSGTKPHPAREAPYGCVLPSHAGLLLALTATKTTSSKHMVGRKRAPAHPENAALLFQWHHGPNILPLKAVTYTATTYLWPYTGGSASWGQPFGPLQGKSSESHTTVILPLGEVTFSTSEPPWSLLPFCSNS